MNRKHKWSAFLAIAMICGSITGCAGTENNSKETVQNSSSIKEESQNQMISILIPLRLYGILMNPQRIIKGQETRSED